MQILGVSHIGIASKDPRKTANFFQRVLGLKSFGEELVLEQSTNTIMFSSSSECSSTQTRLEVLESYNGSGPINDFLLKKGGGIHHIALSVSCVQMAINKMLEMEVEMVDSAPRRGAHNTKVAFVHPRSTGGVLVEFVEECTVEE